MPQLRKCTYRLYTSQMGWSPYYDGLFHCWGLDAVESNEGNISFTVAIVEDVKTKTVAKVSVHEITFVD